MHEALWVIALLVLFGAIGVAQAVPWVVLMAAGNRLMFNAAGIGIPAELVYFSLLAICLHRNGAVPRGWYWRSFEHHHLLSDGQRWVVLPVFFLGAFCFVLIVLGIAVVLLAGLTAVVTA